MRKLVYGAGINDADYEVQGKVNGVRVVCPFYKRWSEVLKRCYSEKYKERKPSYAGCSVCEEWLTFSNFKAWMEKQDWRGKQIDKDIISAGNKIYSPENCAFVDDVTNSFVTDCSRSRGPHLIGAIWSKEWKKFAAACRDPFIKKGCHLGYFNDELSAHLAWKKRKHELACQLADLQTDERVAQALRVRYL